MGSFSNQAKTEICAGIKKPAAMTDFLCGVLLAARRLSEKETVIQTECEAFAGLFPLLLRNAGKRLRWDTEYRTRTGKLPLWSFTLSGKDAAALLRQLQISPAARTASPVLQQISRERFARLAGGCFVMSGSVTDPERSYHLELNFPDADFAGWFAETLRGFHQSVNLKQTQRKGDTILYIKQNEQLCDALAVFGAPNASLTAADCQVYKSIRSQTNRRTNCDLANIDKTLAAGAQQAEDILLIQEKMGLERLPETLQEIAALRLEDREANLRDLGALCHPPISRSGVHHRLARLSEIAGKLRQQESK